MNTRLLLTLMLLSLGCASPKVAPAVSPAPAPLLELRLVQRSANEADAFEFGDSVLYLAPALISDTSITGVRPSVAGSGELILDVHHSPAARERLAAGTQRIGDHLAVVIESCVVLVVPIASTAGLLGRVTINTGLTGGEAERVTALVKARWPAAHRDSTQ